MRNLFQVEPPLRSLFEAPTVAELSKIIQAADSTNHGLLAPPIQAIARKNDLPLAFDQERLWNINQLLPNSLTYNLPISIRLKGYINVTALQQSLNEVVRRHEVLRTTFEFQAGRPIQVIAPVVNMTMLVLDLRKIPEPEREFEARRLVTEESECAFDLVQGPLLRVSLLQLSEDDHVLLLMMHHIISDRWSISVLMHEITTLYAAFSNGKPSPLPELSIQYADFAVWQRQWLQGKVLENQLAYWKKLISGNLPVMELPIDHPRPRVPNFRGMKQSLSLTKCLSEALKRLSRQEGVTLFMTLLAAFKVLLHHYTGQSDIVVGSHTAGRNRPEIEGLIGLFINTVALHADLSGNPSFRSLIAQVRKVCLEAYHHQIPLKLIEELQQQLHPEQDQIYTRPYKVSIDVADAPREDNRIKLPRLTVEPFSLPENIWLQSDLALRAQVRNERIHLDLLYQSSLFNEDTIAGMLRQFQILLESIVEEPDQHISLK